MGAGIIAFGADSRAIPLSATAPQLLSAKYNNLDIVDMEAKVRGPTNYLERLSDFLPQKTVEENSEYWPTSHDQMGDLIILKIPTEVSQYSSEIGNALLAQHSRIRMVLHDNGVKGEWRVRDLETISLRDGESGSTLVRIKENGTNIWVDPTKVYYSPRLETERQETLESALLLKEKLGRPLNVIDPYAGVGPGAVQLVSSPGLVDELFVNDLNPETTALLEKNLLPYENQLGKLTIECVDALKIKNEERMREKFDLLLVNLPHNTLEHIFHLIPLLSSGPALLRGWAIIHEEDIDLIKESLMTIISPHKPNISQIIISPKRTYAPYLVYSSIEIHFD